MCLTALTACSHVLVSPKMPQTTITKEPVTATDADMASVNEIDPVVLQQYQRALTLMAAEKFDRAEIALREIIITHPDLAGPYINLGMIYAQTDRTVDAEHAFEQAIECNPENAIVYNQQGILYRKTGRFDQAVQAYNKALEIDPDYTNAHLNLGILYDLYLNQPEMALIQYKQYQSLTPEEDKQVGLWIDEINLRINQSSEQTNTDQP